MHESAVLVRAQYLLPMDNVKPITRIEDGYVLSRGDKILEAGRFTGDIPQRLRDTYGTNLQIMGKSPANEETWDYSEEIPRFRGVLMPAFVKAHGHDHEQPLIGIAKDEPLTAWLDHAVNPFTGYMNQYGNEITEELGCTPHSATYMMARVSDIHYGITASMVHHCNFNKYHLTEIARANELAGTKMIVAVGSQDRNYVKELLDAPEDAIQRLNRALEIPDLQNTTFCPGPDQLFSNSRKLLIPLKQWAREHGTLFHVHSAEEPATTRWFQREIEPGLTPVAFADQIGILDADSVLAHQVNCGPGDLDILASTGAKVVHNPLANTILGSGMPPVIDMLKQGIPVAISTDGSGSADNQNILAAAKMAAQYQKAHHQDATLLTSEMLLDMITGVPADILNMDQGRLVPGKLADWILIDLQRPNTTPTRLDNVVENLIWATDGSEIDTVFSGGRILKQNGRVLPFKDGTLPRTVMKLVQKLSEGFADYRANSPELKGTGVHR